MISVWLYLKQNVIVHTKDFPDGEIRGNSFVAMDDLFPTDSEIEGKKKNLVHLD